MLVAASWDISNVLGVLERWPLDWTRRAGDSVRVTVDHRPGESTDEDYHPCAVEDILDEHLTETYSNMCLPFV